MARTSTEELFRRYRDGGDLGALAQVYDRLAPELLGLARRQGRAGIRAEDLVQDTFLVALEDAGSFEPGGRVEAWLVGILANRARVARRRAGRALDPAALAEREVARPEEELDREERRHELRAAVAELPAGMRAVVEAKLAGRDAGEIGRELGISAGAARVRLHRALDRLRGMLPPGLATLFALSLMHTSALGATRARVLARARTLGATRGLGVLPALAIGATWMTKKTLAAAALVAALSLYVGLRAAAPAPAAAVAPLSWREALAPPAGSARARTTPVAPDPGPSRPPTTERTRRAAVAGAPLVLAGRVVGADGRPVAGAVLGLWSGAGARDAFEASEPGQRIEADADGRFTARTAGRGFVLVALAEGLVCEHGLVGSEELESETGRLELPELVLVEAHRIAGVVLDEQGRPLEGAVIDCGFPFSGTYETRVGGVFRFDPGALESAAGPVQARVVSDADGAFELGQARPGAPGLEVELAPFLVRRGPLDDGFDPPRAVLRRGPTLRGRVVDSHGRPAAGARVRRHPHWSNVHTVPETVSCDARGEFELPALVPRADTHAAADIVELIDGREPEQVGITVVHAGHAVATVLPVHPGEERAGPGLDVLVELVPERAIAGRVVTREGRPAPGVPLLLLGGADVSLGTTSFPPLTELVAEDLARARADEQGRFRFGQLPAGRYVLEAGEVTGAGFARLEVEAGEEDLRVVQGSTPGCVTLEGVVTETASGAPVTAFEVVPSIDGFGVGRSFVDAEGSFVVHGLEPGEIEVEVRARGFAARELPPRSYDAGRHRLEVGLSRERELELEVFGVDGRPVAGGRLRVLDASGVALMLKQDSLGGSLASSVRDLREGRARLTGLPAERLTVELGVRDHHVRRIPVDLSESLGEPLRVTVVPLAMTDVQLLVVESAAGEQGSELARVWRRGPEALATWAATLATGAEGTPQVPAGLLAAEVRLVFRSEAGELLAAARLLPDARESEDARDAEALYAYVLESTGRSWEVGGSPLPVLELALPTGRVRVERLVDGEAVAVGELELTAAGGEVFEALVLP